MIQTHAKVVGNATNKAMGIVKTTVRIAGNVSRIAASSRYAANARNVRKRYGRK